MKIVCLNQLVLSLSIGLSLLHISLSVLHRIGKKRAHSKLSKSFVTFISIINFQLMVFSNSLAYCGYTDKMIIKLWFRLAILIKVHCSYHQFEHLNGEWWWFWWYEWYGWNVWECTVYVCMDELWPPASLLNGILTNCTLATCSSTESISFNKNDAHPWIIWELYCYLGLLQCI